MVMDAVAWNKHQPWENADKLKVIRLALDNMHPRDIAPMVGRTWPSIYKLLADEGIELPKTRGRRKVKYPKHVVENWKRLIEKGYSRKFICTLWDVHYVYLSRRLTALKNGDVAIAYNIKPKLKLQDNKAIVDKLKAEIKELCKPGPKWDEVLEEAC